MPFADHDGVRIHYHVEGDGPPLVMQAGFTVALGVWYQWGYVDALKADCRLILIDPRGHGASDKPHDPAAYAMPLRAGDVLLGSAMLRTASAKSLGEVRAPEEVGYRHPAHRCVPIMAGRRVKEDCAMAVRTAMDDVLEQAVVAGDIPGVVAMAADANGVVYQGAYGKRTVGDDANMTVDTVFWLASMTKAVTSVAAMQQVERGNLSLDEPIGSVLPELADPQVLDGFDDAGVPRLRPARTPITLRQLLTHTAGYSYHIWNADVARYMEHGNVPTIISCEMAAIRMPLVFDPGERWEYGINIDWAGQAVERVSGLNLNEYLRQEIFAPLGMADTGFVLSSEHRTRLAGMHVRGDDGGLSPIDFEIPQAPEFYMGGGGLYSVGPDYLTFLQMLLHGGTFNGAQILRPETVAEMGRNQIGDIPVTRLVTVDPGSSRDAELFPGMPKRWGLGYLITLEETPTGRSAGSGAWAGLANTFFWLDPTRQLTGLILTQILPFGDPAVLDTFERFERAIYDVV